MFYVVPSLDQVKIVHCGGLWAQRVAALWPVALIFSSVAGILRSPGFAFCSFSSSALSVDLFYVCACCFLVFDVDGQFGDGSFC